MRDHEHSVSTTERIDQVPDATGHFGPYGGRFVPETLVVALDELTREYERAQADPAFRAELDATLRDFAGRPTPLFEARRFGERCGCRVFLKREDLLHTGAHKINNTIGQALLTRRMGKKRIIAETGAGQHGVASATAAAYVAVMSLGATRAERFILPAYFALGVAGALVAVRRWGFAARLADRVAGLPPFALPLAWLLLILAALPFELYVPYVKFR